MSKGNRLRKAAEARQVLLTVPEPRRHDQALDQVPDAVRWPVSDGFDDEDFPEPPGDWAAMAAAGDNPLQALTQAELERRYFEEQVLGCVAAARAQGVGWAEIGAALGVSKQAAWERFR